MLLPTQFPNPESVLVIALSRGVPECEIEKDNGVGRPGKLKPAPTMARLEDMMMVGAVVLLACLHLDRRATFGQQVLPLGNRDAGGRMANLATIHLTIRARNKRGVRMADAARN